MWRCLLSLLVLGPAPLATARNVSMVGSLGRDLEIPNTGNFIQIKTDTHSQADLTFVLSKIGSGGSEVVFSFSPSLLTPSYHNDVFIYYSSSSFPRGRDGVTCSQEFAQEDSGVCRFSLTEYAGGERGEVRWRMSLLDLQPQSDGWYRLEARLGDTQLELELEPRYLLVTVEGPPVFTDQQEEEEIVLDCQERRNLTCSAAGRPVPETVWQEQTHLGDLRPVLVSETVLLAEDGGLLLVSHDPGQGERVFVCVASNRKETVPASSTSLSSSSLPSSSSSLSSSSSSSSSSSLLSS